MLAYIWLALGDGLKDASTPIGWSPDAGLAVAKIGQSFGLSIPPSRICWNINRSKYDHCHYCRRDRIANTETPPPWPGNLLTIGPSFGGAMFREVSDTDVK